MKSIFLTKSKYEIFFRIGLTCFSIVLVIFYVILGNNDVLWCDEIASVVIAKKSLWELLSLTANDVHPPFYYLVLRFLGLLFGFSGPVMRLGSIIPYTLILFCSLTIIWNKYGAIASTGITFLSSFLYCSMHFNVEIRMYSLASFFVLMSFVYFREIIVSIDAKNSILFVMWSLLAAYSHYFCIITVSPFYITILVLGIWRKGKKLKHGIIIWISTILIYLPWAISFFVHYTSTTSKIYAKRDASLIKCLEYIFSSKFSWLLLAIFCLVVIVFYISTDNKYDFLWISIGLTSVICTILIPYAVSVIVTPMMEERLVYPSFIIVWLILGYCVSKIRYEWCLSIVLAILIIPFGIRAFVFSYDEGKREEMEQDVFLEKTIELKNATETVIADEWQVGYPILHYYYSDDIDTILVNTDDEFETKIKDLSGTRSDYWLFLTDELNEIMCKKILDANYECNLVIDNGLLSSHRIWVYKCSIKN